MGVKILLVEDDAIIALNQQLLLEENGFEVVHCHTGEESVNIIITDHDINLVLMDIDLGEGLDGTQTAKKILSIRDLPIIFVTGHNERDMVEKVKGITRYGYVIKNSGNFVLVESITMAIELFKAHSLLKKSEIEYREIIDGAELAIIKVDREGRIIFFSKGAERIFGFRQEEVLGKHSADSINPETGADGTNHSELIQKIFANPANYRYNENENLTKDGKILWMQWYNKAVFDHNGNLMYILCIGNDITEQKLTNKKLEASEKLFRSAFSHTPALMSISRVSDGTLFEINDSFIKLTGYNHEKAIGRTSVDIGVISAEQRDKLLKEFSGKNEIHNIKITMNHVSGKELKCLYSGALIEIEGENTLLSIAQLI